MPTVWSIKCKVQQSTLIEEMSYLSEARDVKIYRLSIIMYLQRAEPSCCEAGSGGT